MILLLFVAIITLDLCVTDDDLFHFKPSPTPFQDWDYLVYSQRWPITGCSEWMERKANNTCDLPPDNSTWIVHGVWPTKTGTKGPFFCDSAIHFDPEQLKPIMGDLNAFWTNIEANTQPTSFWKHEWAKHGTCASSLPQLNSVTNYFTKGLEFNREYNLAEILANANIIPEKEGYNVTLIYNAVQSAIGKNPTIQCVIDCKTKESLISEVRICFNKDLELIDCTKPDSLWGDVLTNCNMVKNVVYLANLPVNTQHNFADDNARKEVFDNYYYHIDLRKLYNFVKFLIWFTF